MDNMSDEEKRQAVGKCNFMLLTLFSSAAFICGIYGNSFCDFAGRSLTFVNGVDPVQACESLNESNEVCLTLVQDHSIGFYSWYGTIPVDQQVCLSYTQYVVGVGYVTPKFDTKFNSAKALGITANVFGFMAWFSLIMASCCPLSQDRLKCLSIYFSFATLFQGLTFLLWRSNACTVGFFSAYFPSVDDVSGVIENVTCSLSLGSKLAVSATVCYFMCMCLTPAAVAPAPIGLPAAQEEQVPLERDTETNE